MKFSIKSLLLITAVLVLGALVLIVSCKKSDSGSSPTWTIMVYGAGNNNLDGANNNTSYIVQDVQDMEKVGSQGGLNIVGLISSLRIAGGAKYYHIEKHPSENPDQISSPVLENLGTRDMSDPATLTAFIDYCKQHYSADRYILLIDDHGAGWPGTCSDDLAGQGSILTMVEMKNAITASTLQHLDIVTFHACLMAQVEVGYQLKDVASFMTACQYSMPMENVLAADLWMDWLHSNMGATTDDVAKKIAEKVIERAQFKQKTTQYGVVKLSTMQDLGAKIGNFGGLLVTASGQHGAEVIDAWQHTHASNLDNPAYVDLREYANNVKNEPNLQQNNLIVQAADQVITAINAAIPFQNAFYQPPDVAIPRGGLTIHFPYQYQDFDSANYVRTDFHSTNWQSFISAFLGAVGGGGQNPTGRCCYNNNANCQVTTQADCQGLNGVWAQGIDCNTPCQQAQTCPTVCPNATEIALNQLVNQCSFAGTDSLHWFKVQITTGNYRFQLGNFAQGDADFDLYTFSDCNTQIQQCFGEAIGPEDFQCSFNGTGFLYLVVHRYSGAGGYSLVVSPAGEPELSERIIQLGMK